MSASLSMSIQEHSHTHTTHRHTYLMRVSDANVKGFIPVRVGRDAVVVVTVA
jgi:hypothetical protein